MENFQNSSICSYSSLNFTIPMAKRPRDDTIDNESSIRGENRIIECPFLPCNNKVFATYLEYEHHIITHHNYECLECQCIFPNSTLLNIHIDENHNPIAAIKQQRGESIYKCLSDNCSQLFLTSTLRQQHMIQTHNYPNEYPFYIINTGIQ